MGIASSKDNDELVDNLVKAHQIRTKDVERAFRLVDRGRFMPQDAINDAYKDTPYKAGESEEWTPGRLHLSAPTMYAAVLERLDLKPGLAFLNIGSGSGWLSTAAGFLLGSTGVNHGIEIHSNLVDYANAKLQETLENPQVHAFEWTKPIFIHGNALTKEFSQQSLLSYDRIYCGAALNDNQGLKRIIKMLRINGKLVTPVGNRLLLYTRTSEQKYTARELMNCQFADLIRPAPDETSFMPPVERVLKLREMCRIVTRQRIRENIVKKQPVFMRVVTTEEDDAQEQRINREQNNNRRNAEVGVFDDHAMLIHAQDDDGLVLIREDRGNRNAGDDEEMALDDEEENEEERRHDVVFGVRPPRREQPPPMDDNPEFGEAEILAHGFNFIATMHDQVIQANRNPRDEGNDPRHARVRLVEVVRRNDDAAEVRHHMRQMMLERRRRERQRMERERERLRFLNEEAAERMRNVRARWGPASLIPDRADEDNVADLEMVNEEDAIRELREDVDNVRQRIDREAELGRTRARMIAMRERELETRRRTVESLDRQREILERRQDALDRHIEEARLETERLRRERDELLERVARRRREQRDRQRQRELEARDRDPAAGDDGQLPEGEGRLGELDQEHETNQEEEVEAMNTNANQEDEDETFHTASDGSRSASAVFREEEEVETEQREETSTASDNSDRRRDRDAEEARPEIGEMNIQLTVTLGGNTREGRDREVRMREEEENDERRPQRSYTWHLRGIFAEPNEIFGSGDERPRRREPELAGIHLFTGTGTQEDTSSSSNTSAANMDDNDESVGRAASNEVDSTQGEAGSSNHSDTGSSAAFASQPSSDPRQPIDRSALSASMRRLETQGSVLEQLDRDITLMGMVRRRMHAEPQLRMPINERIRRVESSRTRRYASGDDGQSSRSSLGGNAPKRRRSDEDSDESLEDTKEKIPKAQLERDRQAASLTSFASTFHSAVDTLHLPPSLRRCISYLGDFK